MTKRLNLLVEGPADYRFFNRILKPLLRHRYSSVTLVEYANRLDRITKGWIRAFLEAGEECILVCDLDDADCAPKKVEAIRHRFSDVPLEHIQVVVQEIESWYLAGVTRSDCHRLRLKASKLARGTDSVRKEHLSELIELNCPHSPVELMVEICRCFHFEQARQRNKSFDRFARKFLT